MHFDFHGFGRALAHLAVEADNDPAVRKVVDLVIDRANDALLSEIPAPLHPVVRHYARRLEAKVGEQLEQAAGGA